MSVETVLVEEVDFSMAEDAAEDVEEELDKIE